MAILLISFFAGPALTVSPLAPSVKHIVVTRALDITYFEGRIGVLHQAEVVSAVGAYLYLTSLIILQYRITGNKMLLGLLLRLGVYFLGIANDSAIALGFYQFFYMSEYAFFLIVVSMAYILLGRFVDVHTAYEKLNEQLEQQAEQSRRSAC